MARLRRTLIIGLGGTGFKTILNAKKMFYENYGEIPPMIGFLGIDTDQPGIANAYVTAKDGTKISLDQREQLAICVEEPQEIYNRNVSNGLFNWMPEPNVSGLTTLSLGAGQMRSNGRFAATVNENKIKDTLSRRFAEVNDAHIINNDLYDLLGAETEVHLVFSLGGGTGSGTFINIAYLIKRLYPKVKLSGYAVLPDVFKNMISGAASAKVRPNGKGALIDLDYLAHLNLNSAPVDINWFHTTDSIKERPFTALYLIDNKNSNNDMFTDVNPLCEMISLAIVTSVGELGVALDSVADNVNKLIGDGAMDVRDKKAWVASMGCAEIIFDGERLAEIYTRKAMVQLVNIMLNGGCADPAQIANNWFDSEKIRENLGRDDVIDYFMSLTPEYTFSDIDSPENPEPECLEFVNSRAVEPTSSLDKKLSDLKHRIDSSLISLINTHMNAECGVYVAENILKNIIHTVNLCDGEMEEELEKLEKDLPMYESSLTTACKELADCMKKIFKKGRKDNEEDVMNRTMALATKKREIERRKYARQFYAWLRSRVNDSLSKIDIIIQNLQATREESNSIAQRMILNGGATSFFQFDLSSPIAETVSCPLSDIVFNNLVLALKESGGIQAFASMSSGQVEYLIYTFAKTLPKVNEYQSMTVDKALGEMNDKDLRVLLNKAINKSLPLISYSYRGYDADVIERPMETYYVGVANKKTSPLCDNDLFSNLVGSYDVQFSETGLTNRIIIYRQLGVIPVYTINALNNLETEYRRTEDSKPTSSHWDKNLCARMKQERFSLEPKNIGSGSEIFRTWMHAVLYDILKYDQAQGVYQIPCQGHEDAKALRGFIVNIGNSREKAYQWFEDNFDLVEREINRRIDEMDQPGPDNKIAAFNERARKAAKDQTYLSEISKCPISLEVLETYPGEFDLLEKEMEYCMNQL